MRRKNDTAHAFRRVPDVADEKTDSIFPAVIGHYMFNESQGALANLLYQGSIPENADLGVIADVFEYLPMIVVAAVFMIMLFHDNSRTYKTV